MTYTQVEVISGKEKGKVGEVLACDKLRNQVKVKGCNMRKLVVDGRVLHIEKKIHYSNVQLVDPLMKVSVVPPVSLFGTTNKMSHVSYYLIKMEADNCPVRVSKKSGYIIPWPEEKPEEEEGNDRWT
ncbi:ribosomal protein L24 [Babesia ovis]|uniref:Large ribosomal subunit protein uL24c n=1 Tax=Babesia ovis TaxID=5869 RepID=A0A9W5TBE4_BABOV|nr:ribosomal protein L24 [Babesia ovis]